MNERKLISICTPCYNEEDNIPILIERVRSLFKDKLSHYDYEHIFIDNCSTDRTTHILEKYGSEDPKIKVIFNSRNFGQIRSPFYGLMQGSGEASVLLVSDLQDPPELIYDFVQQWENGNDVVVGVKTQSLESPLMFLIRKTYYALIDRLSETKLQKNYTGFGLYDKKVIKILSQIEDPYPYLRGLVFEIGFKSITVEYTQPARKRGVSHHNFFSLYDFAMLGITSHSKLPLRFATLVGFIFSGLSLMAAFIYFIYKLIYWDKFSLGMAPVVIGLFLFASVQLFFIGIIGEYIGIIFTKLRNHPLVIEKKRINF